MKNNITFYTHDADSHNHWKFKTLRRKYDWGGEGKFWALNNMVATSPNCLLDISSTNKKKAVAAELEFTLAKFQEYINFLAVDCELITISDDVISTDRTQEDLKRVNRKRESDRDQKSLKNAPIITQNNEVLLPESTTNGQVSIPKVEVSLPKTQLSYPENEQIRLDKIIVENNTDKVVEKTNMLGNEQPAINGAAAPTKADKTEVQKEKQKACLQRREAFKAELRTMKEYFPTEMLNDFYKYWTELNKSKTKMKWEMQQTWELKLRLHTWESRNQKYKQAPVKQLNSYKQQQPQQTEADILKTIFS